MYVTSSDILLCTVVIKCKKKSLSSIIRPPNLDKIAVM